LLQNLTSFVKNGDRNNNKSKPFRQDSGVQTTVKVNSLSTLFWVIHPMFGLILGVVCAACFFK
jgi:hypothetical protein